MKARTYRVPMVALAIVRERSVWLPCETCVDASEAARIARAVIGDLATERLIAIMLDGRGRVASIATLASGGMSGCGCTARDVMRAVLVAHASGFILAHNHPSGDASPSAEDLAFTAKISIAADACGVALLDHVIVTRDGSHSSVPLS